MSGQCRCRYPDGIVIKPDGINPLDPCIYETKEIHSNVTVFVNQCSNCGHIELEWHRTDETEDIIHGELAPIPIDEI